MILRRFYEESLAQASFLVGCGRTGEAAVIDANRDVEQYLRAAAAEGLRITAVTETHIHADYVSGSRELANRTGATLYLSDEGDASWKYAFAGEPNVRLVRHGDVIRIGRVRLDVMRTPGHTPEHIAFLLTDEPASVEPLGLFTGDFVFVGDVGRPDLLERAAKVAGTMVSGARTLFHSLEAFKQLPDRLIVWPAHGSGSACGKSLGGVPMSTVGYEKLANWGLRVTDEDTFVTEVLAGQPEPPAYFKEMKRINREGPTPHLPFIAPPVRDAETLESALARGESVLDLRDPVEAAARPIAGAFTIPLSKSFPTWAGSLLPFDRPVWLVTDSGDAAAAAVRALSLIGYDLVAGRFGPETVDAWHRRHAPLPPVPRIAACDAVTRLRRGEIALVDVRARREYDEGHIPGARHIPLGLLAAQAQDLPRLPIVVHCAAGLRSAMAVSVLRRAGVPDVIDMAGGFREYEASGLPVEAGHPPAVWIEGNVISQVP